MRLREATVVKEHGLIPFGLFPWLRKCCFIKKKILNLNMYYFTDNIEIKEYKETTCLKLGKEKRNTIERTLQMPYFISTSKNRTLNSSLIHLKCYQKPKCSGLCSWSKLEFPVSLIRITNLWLWWLDIGWLPDAHKVSCSSTLSLASCTEGLRRETVFFTLF